MNEVMYTAEDLDIKIYYQDTDSMHIERSRLNDLATEFRRRFDRELIGKDMGQFHNDFDEFADSWAYQSLFNGKKCYIDMLTDEHGAKAVHKRAKGITLTTLDKMATDMYTSSSSHDTALFDLYNDLFEEKPITFDLKQVRACFKNDKSRRVANCSSFTRELCFKGTKNVVKCNLDSV